VELLQQVVQQELQDMFCNQLELAFNGLHQQVAVEQMKLNL
jgi:hypothetical protein